MNRASIFVKRTKDLRWVVAAAVVVALMGGMLASTAAASTPSGSFVYVNNDSSANSVSALAVATDGSLSAIPGSPFATGGAGTGGGLFAARTESLVRMAGRLYVANKGSGTVTGFSIDATTGALTPLPGSPYPTGLSTSGFSLDADPSVGVVFAAGQSTVASLPMNADGSLGSPTFTPTDLADGMEVSPDGQLLALALVHVGRIQIFQVGPGGTLTPAPGSPMAVGYSPTDVRFSPDGSRLFTGSIDPTIRSYAVAGNGALTAGPSVTASGSLQSIVLSPDGTMLFASDVPNRRAWGFTVAADGSMAVAAGSPVGTSSSLPYTTGIGTDPSGERLFVVSTCAFSSCDDEVSAFAIGAGASLTPVTGNAFKTGARGFPTSVVVFDGGGSVAADTTPPSITGSRIPAPNAHGWNNEAVTASFTCEDEAGGSGLASCSDPVTLSGEGAGQSVTGTATDNADNESTAVVGNISIDLTPPSLDGTPTSEPNAQGWYNDNVTVAWSCGDALSGIPGGCPADAVIDGEGGGLSATASVTDRAGNTTVATVEGIDIDRTAPVVSFTGNAGTYAVDEQVDIACAASDVLSGVASHTCAPVSGPAYSFGVGDHTFGAAATDAAGNEGSASVSFTVRATFDNLCNLTKRFSTREGVARSLCVKLDAAAASAARGGNAPQLRAYRNELAAQSGKTLTPEQAELLSELSRAL